MKILYTQRYDEIVLKVVETLEKAGTSRLPISPFEVAQALGIKIRKFSEATPIQKTALSSLQKDGFSFMYTREFCTRPAFIIWYNDTMPQERIRWTIAHEIGHIALEHLEESELAESEANYFAGMLLAAPIFIKMLNLSTESEIQHTLVLSSEASIYAISRYRNRYAYGPGITESECRLYRLFNNNQYISSGGDNIMTTLRQ